MSVNIKKNGALTKLAGLYSNINLRLSQLLDTDISSLEDGQILAYNDETEKWENQEAPAGVEVVDDLATQSATSALSANQGYVLNNALAGKANAADVLPTLITSPANKQILSYDSSSSKWVNSVNGNTVFLGTADPAANLGKEGDLYVKLSSPSYGNSYRIHTKSTGGETASIDVDTITEGTVVATQNINYHWPAQTFPDFSTNYKSSNWSVTITSDNVYGRAKGSTISWPYFQTNDVTLTINPPSVYGIFVKSRGIWIQIGKSPVENFSELKDTNFNNLQDGQLTVYNSTTGKWENQNLPSSTDLFTITLTSSEDPETGETIYTANKLPSEVIAAYNNGDVVQLVMSSGNLPYYFTLGNAVISEDESESETGFMFQRLFVYDNDEAAFGEFILVKEQNVNAWDYIEFIHNFLAVGGNSLVAEITENNNVYTCDKTFEEVNDAYYGSKDIFIKFGSRIFKIARYESSTNTFYFTSTIANANRTDVKTFVMTGSYTTENWTSITLTESSGGDPNAIKWSEAKTSVKKNYTYSINNCTANGVTFTTDSNGVVNANGTASSSGGRLNIIGNSFMLPAGTYKLITEISDSNITDALLTAVVMKSSDNTVLRNAVDKRLPFTLSEDTLCYVGLNVVQNTVYSNVKIKFMVCLASVEDDTYVPYIPDNTELVRYTDNTILGAKNLFNSVMEGSTNLGVSLTYNADGSIKLNGTNSSSQWDCYFILSMRNFKAGTYIISQGITSNKAFLQIKKNNYSGAAVCELSTYSSLQFKLDEDTKLCIVIRVAPNAVLSNLVLYPMIRFASDTDSQYIQYAPTNSEIYNYIKNTSSLGTKNLLENKCVTSTSNGVTFTVNADKSVTINGTNDGTASSYALINTDFWLKKGVYRLSGMPLDYSGGFMKCQLLCQTYDGQSLTWADAGRNGENKIKVLTEDTRIRCIIQAYENQSFDNMVVKPMITHAEIPYDGIDDYVPYCMSVSQLTEKVNTYLEQTTTTSTSANTIYTFTDARITVNSTVDVYTNIFGVSPSNVVLADGSCTVTFPAQSSAQSMTCKIYVK